MKANSSYIFALCILTTVFGTPVMSGAIIHVPAEQTTIQAGISAAGTGDTVLVADGTYTGSGNRGISALGKAVTIQSENGPEACILDCESLSNGFSFSNGETSSTVINGFTILNGYIIGTGGGIRLVLSASPVVMNCILSNCEASTGGGGLFSDSCSPELINCSFIDCEADTGGGASIEGGAPVFYNCTFTSNVSGSNGGAIRFTGADVEMHGCVFNGNSAVNNGGGIYLSTSSNLALVNCAIFGNTAGGNAGALENFNSTIQIQNCTVAENTTGTVSGLGAVYEIGEAAILDIVNSIVWGNTGTQINIVSGSCTVSYSDVQGGWTGTGNLNENPDFMPGPVCDYYLNSASPNISPCIDAGDDVASNICYMSASGSICLDSLTATSDGLTDTGAVDMGAHFAPFIPTPTPTVTPTYTPTMFPTETPTVTPSMPPTEIPTVTPPPTPFTIHVPGDYSTIQAAIDVAIGGDVVLVADGTYSGAGNVNLDFLGKAITVTSENGPDETQINGQSTSRAFYFHNGEDQLSILDGFTIKSGYSVNYGGGIFCDTASPLIRDCIFDTCQTDGSGGAIYCDDGAGPRLENCQFNTNQALHGGAISSTDGSVPECVQCTFYKNVAASNGGAISISSSNPALINCKFYKNKVTTGNGGAINISKSTCIVFNSFFSGNTADLGAAIFLVQASPSIGNCTFYDNTAATSGGAIYCIHENSAATVIDSILWNDSPGEVFIDSGTVTITYSDVEGGYSGTGNINQDPAFTSGYAGVYFLDYEAKVISPCINFGSSPASTVCYQSTTLEYCLDEFCTRADGVPDSGTVDMGAHYELHTPEVLSVPGDYTTIQVAIDAALYQDTVMLSDGTYTGPGNKNLDFMGKIITVTSENGPEECIIDCEADGRAFYFYSGEDSSSVLHGITFRNGGNVNYGAGIYCHEASPLITGCVFTGCETIYGGGLALNHSDSSVTDCVFHDLNANYGGAIYCDESSCAVVNCLLFSNNATNFGGGIYCSWNSDFLLLNSTLAENTIDAVGTCGGVYIYSSAPEIRNCVIWNNAGNDIYTNIASPIVTYSDIEDFGVFPGVGNLNVDPGFLSGPAGNYYLDHAVVVDSDCINAGSDPASSVCYDIMNGTECMDQRSTHIYQNPDLGTVDMGYHYPVLGEGTLSGHVDLERPGTTPPNPSWATELTVILCKNGTEWISYAAVTGWSGNFTVPLIAGTYNILVKGNHSLAAQLEDVVIPANASTSLQDFGLLPEGDANDDNILNSQDFFILKDTYNLGVGDSGYDSRADFNQDETVTSQDFFLLRGHYNQAGEGC